MVILLLKISYKILPLKKKNLEYLAMIENNFKQIYKFFKKIILLNLCFSSFEVPVYNNY